MRRLLLSLLTLAALCVILCATQSAFAWTHGNGGAPNAQSAVGLVLSPITPYGGEQPFANIFVNSQLFTTTPAYSGMDTGEGDLLCLDSNGWVTTMSNIRTSTDTTSPCTATPVFQWIQNYLNFQIPSPSYPTGNYDVYYSGSCTFSYADDASVVSQSAGHDVFNVASASGAGIRMNLTAMGSGGNYCHNVSVTRSALTAAYLGSSRGGTGPGCNQFTGGPYTSACFDPEFLTFMAPFRAVRMMEWMCTNDNTNNLAGTWAGRPLPAMPFYGSTWQIGGTVGATQVPCGVPIEMMVALANAGNLDLWLNMPTLATPDYVTHLAEYVAANLNSNLYVYVEYSNETWNYGFYQFQQLISLGIAATGTANSSGGTSLTMTGVTGYFVDGSVFTGTGVPSNTTLTYASGGSPGGDGVYTTSTPTTLSSVSVTDASVYTQGGSDCVTNSTLCQQSVMGHSTQNFGAIFKTAFGSNSSHVKVVMASQACCTGVIEGNLACISYSSPPCTSGIDYAAGAAYFGTDAGGTSACSPNCTPSTTNSAVPDGSVASSYSPSPSWLLDGSSPAGINSVFTAIETGGNMAGYPNGEPPGDISFLAQSSSWISADMSLTTGMYGIPWIAYEDGSGFTSENYDPTFTTPFIAAKIDPRMGTAYTNHLNAFKSVNVPLVMLFEDIYPANKYGAWGLENGLCGDGATCNYEWTESTYLATTAWMAANPCTWMYCLAKH